jgi:adenosylcobinamide kinase / adenosylcobinamide-phosphate guanylyltransferase
MVGATYPMGGDGWRNVPLRTRWWAGLMEVVAIGTGGARGWPEPSCRCASCQRAAADGKARKRSTILVGGRVLLGGDGAEDAVGAGVEGSDQYLVRGVPGGWDVTGPDGERLLYPAEPGAVPVPPDGTQPYDIAFVDVLADPYQLGLLRARGLVTEATTTVAACADHRVSSIGELQHRCAMWQVKLANDGDRVTTVRSPKRGVYRVLVLGGARSGKSERAELRVAAEPAVTYVATGPSGDTDPDWATRVAAHRARRPAWWRTVETTDIAGVVAAAKGAVLIDGIGTWLAAVLDEDGWDTGKLDGRITELTAAWRQANAYVVAVSDETGLGVIPETSAGRVFRDWLGRINQALAAESEEAELVVAGKALPLESLAARWVTLW